MSALADYSTESPPVIPDMPSSLSPEHLPALLEREDFQSMPWEQRQQAITMTGQAVHQYLQEQPDIDESTNEKFANLMGAIYQKAAPPTAESAAGSFFRPIINHGIPAVGTAIGGIIGSRAAGALGIESGPGAVAAAAAGDVTGGLIGGTMAQKAQDTYLGPVAVRRQQEQEAADAEAHPFATRMGGMIPGVGSMFGGGATKATNMGGRAINAAVGGARASGSAAGQAVISHVPGSHLTDIPKEMIHGAVTAAPLGLLGPARNLLTSLGVKAPADAALMATSQALYDRVVNGKPLDLREITGHTAEEIPGFLLLNALGALLHKVPGKTKISDSQTADSRPESPSTPPASGLESPNLPAEVSDNASVTPGPAEVVPSPQSAEGSIPSTGTIYPTVEQPTFHVEPVEQSAFSEAPPTTVNGEAPQPPQTATPSTASSSPTESSKLTPTEQQSVIEGSSTAMKNAAVKARFEALGLPEPEAVSQRPRAVVQEQANLLTQDPAYAGNRLRQLEQNPDLAYTDVDTLVLQHYEQQLTKHKPEGWLPEIKRIGDINRRGGSAAAYAMLARKAEFEGELPPLSKILSDAETAKGATLTPEEAQVFTSIHERPAAPIVEGETPQDTIARLTAELEAAKQGKTAPAIATAQRAALQKPAPSQITKDADAKARTLLLAMQEKLTKRTPPQAKPETRSSKLERRTPADEKAHKFATAEADDAVAQSGILDQLPRGKIEIPFDWKSKPEWDWLNTHLDTNGKLPTWLRDKFTLTNQPSFKGAFEGVGTGEVADPGQLGEHAAQTLQAAQSLHDQAYAHAKAQHAAEQKALAHTSNPKPELDPDHPDNRMFSDPFLIASTARALHVMAREAATFVDFSRRAITKLGDWIKPHLRALWESAKDASYHAVMRTLQRIGSVHFMRGPDEAGAAKTPENSVQNAAKAAIFKRLYGNKKPPTSSNARRLASDATREYGREHGSSGPGEEASRDAGATGAREKTWLIDWAKDKGLLLSKLPEEWQFWSDKDLGAMEHHVFFDQDRVIKVTKSEGNKFGMFPIPYQAEWDFRPSAATAMRYMDRLVKAADAGDDVQFHGVLHNRDGTHIITSQPRYKGTLLTVLAKTPEEFQAARVKVANHFRDRGFIPIGSDARSFYRAADNLAVFDAHLGNVILQTTAEGELITPFDVVYATPKGKLLENIQRFVPDTKSEGRLFSDPLMVQSAAHALHVMAREAATFVDFSRRALTRFGEWIKPHLSALWESAKDASYEAVMRTLQRIGAVHFADAPSGPSLRTNPTGLHPHEIAAHAEIMAADLRKGLTEEQARRELRRNFNGTVDPHFNAIFSAAHEFNDKLAAKEAYQHSPQKVLADAPKAAPGADIDRSLAHDLAVAHLRESFSQGQHPTEAELTAQVKSSLEQHHGRTLETRDVREAWTDYGRQHQPSADELRKLYHELKTQSREHIQLQRLQAKLDLLKNGGQHTKPSAEVRRLRQEVSDLKRKLNYQPKDPASQLASARTAVINALNNQIETTQKVLDGLLPYREPGKGVFKDDPAIRALRTELADLKKAAAELHGPTSSELAESSALRAAERATESYTRRTALQDIGHNRRAHGPISAAVDTALKAREAAREAYQKMREADPRTQAEKQQAALDSLDQRIAQASADLAAGRKLKPTSPNSKFKILNSQLQSRLADLVRLREQLKADPRFRQSKTAAAIKDAIEREQKRASAHSPSPLSQLSEALPDTPEMLADRATLQALRDLRAQTPAAIAAQDAAYQKTRAKQIAKTNARIDADLAAVSAGSVPAKIAKIKKQLDHANTQALAELNDKKQALKHAIASLEIRNAPTWLKTMTAAGILRRANILMGYTIIGKLSAAAAYRILLTLPQELSGAAWSTLLPDLAKAAPREGGFSSKALRQAATGAYDSTARNWKRVLKTGTNDIQSAYGDADAHAMAESGFQNPRLKKIERGIQYPTNLHPMLKLPAFMFEFHLSEAKRINAAEAAGLKPTAEPALLKSIREAALEDAKRAIFQNANVISDAVKGGLSSVEHSTKHPAAGKAFARFMKFEFPILNVPTNIVLDTAFNTIAGLPIGGIRVLMMKALKQDMASLPPAKADAIMRQLKHGTVGALAVTYFFLHPQNAGGFYQEHERRKHGEVPAETIRIGGYDIPHALTHAPIWDAMQFAATVARVAQAKDKHHQAKGILEGVGAGTAGLYEKLPLVRGIRDVGLCFASGPQGAQSRGRLAGSLLPNFISEIARDMDRPSYLPLLHTNPRKAETFTETLQSGIPYLREQLPLKKAH